jgi:hypothetical protein
VRQAIRAMASIPPAMRRRLLAGKGICVALRIRFMVKKAEAREKAVMITGRDTSNLKRTFLVISFGAEVLGSFIITPFRIEIELILIRYCFSMVEV